MAVVIAACYLVALLVPMWLMLVARMDSGNAGTWRSSAAATAVAAAVMMGFFTGAVLILVDDTTERIVSMIAGLLICLSEQAVLIANTIREFSQYSFDVRWTVIKGIAITGITLMALALSTCVVAAFQKAQ